MENKKFLLLLIVLVLIFVSLFPRIVEVLNHNPIFLLDQGRDYLAVKNIVVNKKLTLIGAEVGSGMAGLQGLFHGPFYFYLLAIPFVIFNGDPYGGVLLMFGFGLATIAMGLLFGKKSFGILGGFLIAFLVALSPPLIAQSRFVWSPHPAAFFILLAFYFTYLSYDRKKLYIFFAAFLTGFLYNFEFAIAVPMSIALFLYMIFILRKKKYDFLFVVAGFFLAYAPLLLFEIKHGLRIIKGFGNYFSHPNTAIKIDTGAFLHNFNDTFSHQQFFPWGFVLMIFLLGLVYFLILEKQKKTRFFIYFLGLVWITTFVTFSLIRTHIFEYYLIHLNLITIFLFAYICVRAITGKNPLFQIVFGLFFAAFFFYGVLNSLETARKDYIDFGGMAKMKGKTEVIDYIYNDAQGKQFGLFIFSPPVYTYPYDYLIWWHGQRQYGYLPHQEKRDLFYLLIEKDLGQEWTYQGWLETVIKKGKVIDTITLPSGFIIQKRVNEES